MSSITHARLAPITQRYLSMSVRRHDIHDRSVPICLSYDQSAKFNCGRYDKRHDQLKLVTCWSKVLKSHNHLTLNDNFCSETNTPKSSVNGSFFRPALVNASSFHETNDVIRNCYTETKRDSCRYQQCKSSSHLQELFNVSRYLLEAKWKLKRIFNDNFTSSSDTLNHFNEIILHRWNYRYGRKDKEGCHGSRGGPNFNSFYVMLGLLGIFRAPTTSEIEEERAQLTDEQKVKKMKPIELKIARGVLSMCDQDYSRANQLFHDALHMAQDDNDEERENLVLNLIASNYFESGEFQKAELLFIDLMKRLIAHNIAPTAPPILELSLKLASIYSKSPTTQDKALKGFKFVISSLLSNLDDIVNDIEELDIQNLSDEKRDELALLGWSYDWFAKHLLVMNDYNAAADMLQRAFQISSLVLGPLHEQTLILLNDIGTTLAMNNAPEEGEKFIKKAVEGAITNQSKELASFYVNLGLVNLKLRKLHEAKRYCEYSMELAKKNRDHYNTQEVIELSRTCSNEVQRLLDAERQ